MSKRKFRLALGLSVAATKRRDDRIYSGQVRQHLVHRVMDELRDWRLSPFENEGPCRAGLRSALCLDGYGWTRSDREAASIVAEGLRMLGARRPTHEQGQKEYTGSPDSCSYCLGPLDEECKSKKQRFCTADCARRAYENRAYRDSRKEDSLAQHAFFLIRTDEAPLLDCQHCGKGFKRFGAQWRKDDPNRDKYCSETCQHKALRVYADRNCLVCRKSFHPSKDQVTCSPKCAGIHKAKMPEKACICCGETYRVRQKTDKGKFCSFACRAAYKQPTTQYRRICTWCSTPFTTARPHTRFCKTSCQSRNSEMRSGARIPKRLIPPVFDYVFAMAA